MFAGSVIDGTYLAEARVMARSAQQREPDARVAVLVVDVPPERPEDEPFEVLTPADVGIDGHELARRAALYHPQELVSSLKPALVRHLLDRGDGPVALLDADVLVLGDLDPLVRPARTHPVVLTPHSPVPSPYVPGQVGPEQAYLRHGVFNGGVMACGPGAEPFLDWWAARTARDSIVDLDRSLVMSQAWLSLVPALFDHHVCRDRGVNLTGHNLLDADVEWREAGPTVDGVPLRVHHFAGGFRAHDPLALYPGVDRLAWWADARTKPGLARLCEHYAALLLAAGHDAAHARTRTIDRAGDVPLDLPMRTAYRSALLAGDDPPTPLRDPEAFLAWLAEGNPVSRWLAALRDLRADLQAAFGTDDAALAAWAASKGDPGPHGLPLAAETS